MSKNKIRATILDIPGKERYNIIYVAVSRYNLAMNEGYYIEATALIESLICDRLESRLGELTLKPIPFDTIGNLLNKLRKVESDKILIEIMNVRLNLWCNYRNKTIHQAAKIELGKKKEWNTFIKDAKRSAIQGKQIFNEYDKQLKRIRKI